ncbi:UNVERIFIED_CONTAM: glycosyltransferase family 2 protein, partial [Bacteroidetes bacterium 56_B9]
EVIVVDDNNPEMPARKRTELLMQQYAENAKVKYIKHEHNKNGAAARNTGIQIAKGEYIAFLDDDDEYYKNRIRICVDTLSENPEYDAVYTE